MLPSFVNSFLKPKLKRQRPFLSNSNSCQLSHAKRTEELMDVVDYAESTQETETPSKRLKSEDRVQVIRIPPLDMNDFTQYQHQFQNDSCADRNNYQAPFGHGSVVDVNSKINTGTSNLTLHSNHLANRKQSFIVKGKEMRAFFRLLEDEVVHDFLEADKCMKISDKYLVAMVFAYFKRAEMKIREYTRINFFVALYLGNDMEEDEEEDKYEIFPWALGQKWQDKFPRFLRKRDLLWSRIDYMALVSKRCCEEIMAIEISHPAWKRTRQLHHAGAIRGYMREQDDDGYPRGPHASPRRCPDCDNDSQYDSASPESAAWYISSGENSPNSDGIFDDPRKSRFDMNRLKKTLPNDEDDAWPSVEE